MGTRYVRNCPRNYRVITLRHHFPFVQKFSRYTRSTIARVTIVYLTILLATLSSLGAYVYWRVSEQMWQQLELHIETEIEGLAEQYQTSGLHGMLQVIDERLARIPDRRSIYLVEDKSGQWLMGNISKWPQAAIDNDGWLTFEVFDKSQQAMTSARVRTFTLSSGARLLVGRDTSDIINTASLIRQALFWGVGIALLLGCGCAIFFSRRAWTKLREIGEVTQKVVGGELDVRVPEQDSFNDLDELARNINLMLEEINHLMTGIERVSDNIAHDLKTPLARVRNRLADVADQSDLEIRTNANACLHEIDELIATFNSILRIARLEYCDKSIFNTRCDLNLVAENCVELYRPIAEDRQQSISVHGNAGEIVADEQLINQAICNMLDNAIKFSNPSSTVEVMLCRDAKTAGITVADHGCGIDQDDEEKVLQRFYRAEPARHSKGNGLGLSLVKAIADAHDANLCLENNHPGLKISLTFPLEESTTDEVASAVKPPRVNELLNLCKR